MSGLSQAVSLTGALLALVKDRGARPGAGIERKSRFSTAGK